MKILKNIITAISFAAAVFSFGSCNKSEIKEARAVLTSENHLTFEAKDAKEQTISVYCDGKWSSDAPEWINIEPSEGSGPMEVKIMVDDNVTDGNVNSPRTGNIIFKGISAERQGFVTIEQRGDKYKGIQEVSVTDILDLEDKEAAKISESSVLAVSKSGFVITDGKTNLYVLGEKDVKVGDKININGKKTKIDGFSAFNVDEVKVNSHSDISYPSAKDITSELDTFHPETCTYVSVTGSLVGDKLRVSGTYAKVLILDAVSVEALKEVDLHKITLKGYVVGETEGMIKLIMTSFDDKGKDESLIPYPLKFFISHIGINYATSFPKEGKIEAMQGLGTITYVPVDLNKTNDKNKFELDVESNDPRCSGSWPGDYWLFTGTGAIKAGSEVKIAFETRASRTGHKFWRLEYLDGTEWRTAGEVKTTKETGEQIKYTHAMSSDGSTNIPVKATVRFRKNVEHCQFRFLCVANWQSNGDGPLSTRNGGTVRLSVTNPESAEYQPHIEIVKEGNGVETEPVIANLKVSTDIITFEGSPSKPIRFTVSSDKDFTVAVSEKWLHTDIVEGKAGEKKVVALSCDASTLSVMREAVVKIQSGDTEKQIRIIQSAAGQTLKPLISIIGGNRISVMNKAGSSNVKVQANVAVSAKADESWIKVTAIPSTKSMVEETTFKLEYDANNTKVTRTAHILFSNAAEGLESVLTVSQDGIPWFYDDFSWMKEFADPAKAADSVGDNNAGGKAPNAYNKQKFLDTFKERGYVDLNPKPEVLYLQKYYLKFGKTNYHTGLQLPAIDFGESRDVVLKFDWAAHMQGSGNIDKVKIVIELSGAGACGDTGAALSKEYSTSQVKGKLEWQHCSILLKGVTKDTKINIRPAKMNIAPKKQPDQQRWYIDNIRIVNP